MPECYQPFTSDKIDVELVEFFVNNNEDADEQTIINLAIQGTILPGSWIRILRGYLARGLLMIFL